MIKMKEILRLTEATLPLCPGYLRLVREWFYKYKDFTVFVQKTYAVQRQV